MINILNSKYNEKVMDINTNSGTVDEVSSIDYTSSIVMSIENFSYNISDSSTQYDKMKPKELIVKNNIISDFNFNTKDVNKKLLYDLNGFTNEKMIHSLFQNNSQADSSVQFVCVEQSALENGPKILEVDPKEKNPFLSSIYEVNTENILKNKDIGCQTENFLSNKNSSDISCQTDLLNPESLFEFMKHIFKK